MIDILIPTYNRSSELKKNIVLIDRLLKEESLTKCFRILVSDNCSTDSTSQYLESAKYDVDVEIKVFTQESNIGLERNAVFLLCESSAEYIMFLGDDDYLPSGYFRFIFDMIGNDSTVSAIVPGFSELYAGGVIRPHRDANFKLKEYPASFKSVFLLSYLGHQLSGLVCRRDGLAETYLAKPELRNIYPFIFFLAYNCGRGSSCFAPKYQVLVSQSNSKDWAYDDSGLLTEIFRNFKILYPSSMGKRLILSLRVMVKQSWRIRVGAGIDNVFEAIRHIWLAKDVDLLIKLSVPLLCIGLYAKRGLGSLKRRFE